MTQEDNRIKKSIPNLNTENLSLSRTQFFKPIERSSLDNPGNSKNENVDSAIFNNILG